jgi:hypothetical protein
MSNPTYLERVADAYRHAPVIVAGDIPAWKALAAQTMATAERIKGALDVRYTPAAEPYPTAYDMLRDIARGRIVVSTANSTHPVWTLEENVAFRLVHDVVGHGSTGSGFDWAGEWTAYEKHLSLLEGEGARHALFTEAVGQVAYALVYGGFTVQKVATLPQWMQWDAPQAFARVEAA